MATAFQANAFQNKGNSPNNAFQIAATITAVLVWVRRACGFPGSKGR